MKAAPSIRRDLPVVPPLLAARAAAASRRAADLALLESALAWCRQHLAEPVDLGGALVDSSAEIDGHAVPATAPIDREGEGGGVPGAPVEVPGVLFGDRALALAGRGAPLVWEFAVYEFSAVVGFSTRATLDLIADVLDLAFRLPRLWARVQSGRLAVSLARHAATCSHDLDLAAADHADRLLAGQPGLNPHRIRVLVDEARLYADPDREVAGEQDAAAHRHVTIDHEHSAPGASEVSMILDTEDAEALVQTVTDLAAVLAGLGHPGDGDTRRAASVGILADPQHALDLLAPDPTESAGVESAVGPRRAGGGHPDGANPFRRHHRRAPDVAVVLHLSDRALLTHAAAGDGVVLDDRLGAWAMEQVTAWLADCAVTVRPVLDPYAIGPVDRHDPPSAMVEAMRLRDPVCVFPACARRAEFCDADHIADYVPLDRGGPPGQTRLDNLAPLCRRHHRVKTHGDFTYHRLPDGSYQWSLPSGVVVGTDPPPREPHSPR